MRKDVIVYFYVLIVNVLGKCNLAKQKYPPEETETKINADTSAFEADTSAITKRTGVAKGNLSDVVRDDEYSEEESLISNFDN